MPPTEQHPQARDYAGLVLRLGGNRFKPLRNSPRTVIMDAAIDALWKALGPTGVSWIGFYLKEDSSDDLVLGPRRDKPACSPIALHGLCGRCYLERRPIIVRDVVVLGENYIACDPRDRSEVVIPLLAADGSCWGVLDADSHDVGAFAAADAAGLTEVVELLGLSTPPARRPSPLIL